MKLGRNTILREMELLDWSGHVELPMADMVWLATQLYARLSTHQVEICEACGNPAPVVTTTPLGPICAECVKDWGDSIEQIEEVLGE